MPFFFLFIIKLSDLFLYKMSLSKQEIQHQFVLHFWNERVQNIAEIQRQTSISRSTIYNIIKKIKETGTVEHAG